MSLLPVSAEYTPDGWESPGISFEDYSRMETQIHSAPIERKLETPEWALNDQMLRSLLVHFMEDRARIKPQPGREAERLKRAQEVMNGLRPQLLAAIKTLSRKYVALKQQGADAKTLRKLASTIESFDTTLINNENIAAKAAQVVYSYYRRHLDSVATSMEIGTMKPPHVRQLLWRLRRTWERMEQGHYDRPLRENRALCSAGPVAKRGPKPGTITKVLDAQIAARLIAEGKSLREVCKAVGACSKTVLKALRVAGLYQPRPFRARAGVDAIAVAVARAEGLKFREVAELFGVSLVACQGAVARAKKAGIKIEDYASYVRYAGRVGVKPMTYRHWRLLESECKPKQLSKHQLPF